MRAPCGPWRCCSPRFGVGHGVIVCRGRVLGHGNSSFSGLSAAAGRPARVRWAAGRVPAGSGLLDVVLGLGGPVLDVGHGALAFGLDVLGGVGGGGLDVFHGFLGRFLQAFGHVLGGLGQFRGERFGRGLQGVRGFAFLLAGRDQGGDQQAGAERDQAGRQRVALGFGLDLGGGVPDRGAGVAQVRPGAAGGGVHIAGGVVGCSHDFLLHSKDGVLDVFLDLVGLAVDDVGRGDLVRHGVDVGAQPGAGCFDICSDGVRVFTHRVSSLDLGVGLRVGGISWSVSAVWGMPLIALSSLRPMEARMAAMMPQMTATTTADQPSPITFPSAHQSARDRNSRTKWPATPAPASMPRALAGPGRGLLELDLGQLDFLAHQGGHVPRDIAQQITQGRRLRLRVRGRGRRLRYLLAHRRPPSKGIVAERILPEPASGRQRARSAQRSCRPPSPSGSASSGFGGYGLREARRRGFRGRHLHGRRRNGHVRCPGPG